LEQKWGWVNEILNSKSQIPNPSPTYILPLPLGGGGLRWGWGLEFGTLGFRISVSIEVEPQYIRKSI